MSRNPQLLAPPQPQPLVPPVEPRREEVRNPILGVMAVFIENFIGGFGVFLAACVVYIAIASALESDVVIESMATVAGLLGVFVFGAACAFRAFRDEASDMLAAHGSRQDVAARVALQELIAQQTAEIEQLRSELQTKSDVDMIRAAEVILRRAYIEGKGIARADIAEGPGRIMPRGDWEAATEACRGAGVLDGKGKPLAGLTFDAAWAKLMQHQNRPMGRFVVARDGSVVKQK